MTDYYDILGIPKTSTTDEIRKAYKKLALASHPDKHSENKEAATAKFGELSEAYSVLSDPAKRKRYDQFGKESIGGQGGAGFEQFNEMFKNMGGLGGLGGIFSGIPGMSQMFGSPQKEATADIKIKVGVPLNLCYKGETIEISIPRKSFCLSCDGYGSTDKIDHDCPTCLGVGMITKTVRNGPFIQQHNTPCTGCSGQKFTTGYTACPTCNGQKLVDEQYNCRFVIPKGITPGESITLTGEGSVVGKNSSLKLRHDIILLVQDNEPTGIIRRHPTNPMNLTTELTVSLSEALCGFSKEITHLDDRTISITCGDVCTPNHCIVITGEGMKKLHKDEVVSGDLVVSLKIEYPVIVRSRKALWKDLEACEFIPYHTPPGTLVLKAQEFQEKESEQNDNQQQNCKQM